MFKILSSQRRRRPRPDSVPPLRPVGAPFQEGEIVKLSRRRIAAIAAAALVAGSGMGLWSTWGGASSAQATIDYGSNIAPDLSDPLTLLSNDALRVGIWKNFQRFVHGCMLGNDVFNYAETPVPTGLSASITPVPTSTGYGYDLANSRTKTVSKRSATTAGVSNLTDAQYYQRWLRNATVTTITQYQSADYAAYDGVTISRFGTSSTDTAGCEAAGRRLVSEPAIAALRELDPDITAFRATLAQDPNYAELNNAWGECMYLGGYNYGDLAEPTASLSVEMDQIQSTSGPEWTAFKAKEAQVAGAANSCMASAGLTNYINSTLGPQWTSFVNSHLALLQRAGGMTNENGVGAA